MKNNFEIPLQRKKKSESNSELASQLAQKAAKKDIIWVSAEAFLGVDGDWAKAIRDAISSLGSTGGVVLLPKGELLLKTVHPSPIVAAPAFEIPSNVYIKGAGRGLTVLLVNDTTPTSLSQIVSSINTSNIGMSDLTIKNKSTGTADTYFYDGLYLKTISNALFENIEFAYDTIGFQFNINLSHKDLELATASQFGSDVIFRNCRFNQLCEFHQTHNLKVDKCEWLVDLDAFRPTWMTGAAQTAFKFSGKSDFQKNVTMSDCRIEMKGNTQSFVPFEVLRNQNYTLNNVSVIGLSSFRQVNLKGNASGKPEYGIVTTPSTGKMIDCKFENVVLYTYELTETEFEGCEFNNSLGTASNIVVDPFNRATKESSGTVINKVSFKGCTFKGGGRFFVCTANNDDEVTFTNCKIHYDSAVYASGIEVNSDAIKLFISNCLFLIKGNSNYVVKGFKSHTINISNSVFAPIDGTVVAGDSTLYFNNSHTNVVLEGNSIFGVKSGIKKDAAFAVVTKRKIQEEDTYLISPNGTRYKVTVGDTGTLTTTAV